MTTSTTTSADSEELFKPQALEFLDASFARLGVVLTGLEGVSEVTMGQSQRLHLQGPFSGPVYTFMVERGEDVPTGRVEVGQEQATHFCRHAVRLLTAEAAARQGQKPKQPVLPTVAEQMKQGGVALLLHVAKKTGELPPLPEVPQSLLEVQRPPPPSGEGLVQRAGTLTDGRLGWGQRARSFLARHLNLGGD